ncbi:hypothetical protein TTHERM_00196340 (macronuclear) [Tetrahymena thermophila SB210]|uniref:Uncharacterized protein n=1 Tax=Tetrahymena thermophila (strain SB210) TaxID=312017 RepID=Q23K00_TETTS|nr:hypothetical protein TTHERM_00196340 [Tetrahymena thermophila SB210]EAR97043.1 hypothetical protein TTHERM_00196340 [Tetrahymena thermophila SB210]|eukprot:XP_001017288.1 hypothetical protein TTHERM_00196340 [Tetrahymena thermophila SB210]
MAEQFLEKYLKAENKIQEILTAGSSDPSIKQKILNYIIEGVNQRDKYLAALQVYVCALSNQFVQTSDIKLNEIEKRLFSIIKKNKDDQEIVEQLSIVICKAYSLFIKDDEENINYKKQFPVFFQEFEVMIKQKELLLAALSILKQVIVNWPDFYTSYQDKIIESLQSGLSHTDKKTFTSAVKVALMIIQQQPIQQLRQFNPLIDPLVQKIYKNLSAFDTICMQYFEECIVSQSILFRKHYNFILEQLNKQLNDSSIDHKIFQSAIKSWLLLFDKQKSFIIQQHTSSSIKNIYSLIFSYLATDNINEELFSQAQEKKKSSIKLISLVNNPIFAKTQFALKQLRDLSKIMTLQEVKNYYIEIFVEFYQKSVPSFTYAAFIGFSTIGEYKITVQDLVEFSQLAVKKIKKGTIVEKFAVLNSISFMCDFLGAKFTNKFQTLIMKNGLIFSLQNSNSERALIYQTLTLFIGNLKNGIEIEDLKQIFEAVNKDLKEQDNESAKYYSLILIDLLIQKYNNEMKVYSDDLYNLIKKLKSENIDLNCLKYEVQANFIQNYSENKHFQNDVENLVNSAIQLKKIENLEGVEQYNYICNQINILFKITQALQQIKSINKKSEILVSASLIMLEKSIEYLIQKKQNQEEEEENPSDLDNNQDEIDLNAPRKIFQALKIIFEENDKAQNADKVLQLGLKVLSDLNDHLNLRDSVIDILPCLFKILKERKSENLQEGVYEMIKSLVNNMQAETDHGVVLDQLELIYKTLEQVGKCFDAETVKSIMIFLFEVCQNAVENIDQKTDISSKNTHKKSKDDDEDEDDEEDDDEEEEDDEEDENEEEIEQNKEELELVQAIGPIIELLYKTHTEEAYQCFDEIICERVLGLCDSEDENFKLVGYNIISNLISILGYEKLKDYIEEIFAYLTEGIEAQMYSLKQTSVYGLGLLCQIMPQQDFKQYKLYISEAIISCILHEPEGINLEEEEMDEELEEEFTLFIDNSISALAKLIKYQNFNDESGPFIDLLPIKMDEEEGLIAHEIFVDLILENKFSDEFNKEIKEAVLRIKESEFINDSILKKLNKILTLKQFK